MTTSHTPPARPPVRLLVLAGVNGAGKSSVLGRAIREAGGQFFDPDERARELMVSRPCQDIAVTNGEAWSLGSRMLEQVEHSGGDFALETTLGGRTYPRRFHAILDAGGEVRMRYLGLDGVELHLARVRARVGHGGHDIPEEAIRRRYVASPMNLLSLMPHLTELELLDNTAEVAPGERPTPLSLLQMARGHIIRHLPLSQVPDWAQGLVGAAIDLQERRAVPRV